MLTSVTPGVDVPGNNGSQVAIPTATLELLAEKVCFQFLAAQSSN